MAKATAFFPVYRLSGVNLKLSPLITHIILYGAMRFPTGVGVCVLCYPWVSMCIIMPVFSFVCPQRVCVLADGNRWDRQPRGRGSSGPSSAGEWHHPPRLVLTVNLFLFSRSLYHPLLFPYRKPNLPQSNLLCAAHCRACKCLPLLDLTF